MSWRRELSKLGALFRRPKLADDLKAEIRSHIEIEERENLESGMPPAEAHYAALRRFGNVTLTQERSREMWVWNTVETLWQDIRYAVRLLQRSPGFTATAIAALALGLAASTAIFSVINGVLLEPLEYANPGQLVGLQLSIPGLARKFPTIPLNPPTYLAWSHQAKSLSGIAVFEEGVMLNLTGGGAPALLSGDAITANLFEVLGVQPRLGRNFLPGSNQAVHDHEAILTNRLWQSRFHGDPRILGRAITLNGSRYTIVGVLPASFRFPRGNEPVSALGPMLEPEIFVPEALENWRPDVGSGLGAIARLKPGVSRSQAIAELNLILSRSAPAGFHPRTVMMPLRDMIVHSSKRGLWLLFAAVLAVLLIICLNLASLMLTRATIREHEAAIRSAFGAGRGRLLRQALVETLLLTLSGGALGLLLAHWVLWALLATAPSGLPRVHNVRLDGAVVGFTLLISVLAGVLAGLLPAWRMARANPQDALHSAGLRGAERRSHSRVRELLVGLETALGVVLLLAAGLLLASFAKLQAVPKGFAVENILTVNLQLPAAEYTQAQQRSEFWRSVLAATSKLPGVQSSAVTSLLPLGGEMAYGPVNLPGDARPVGERPFASYRLVSPGFFETLGIPLLRGRELRWADARTGAVVISQVAAKTIWPAINPLGQRFDVDPRSRFPGYWVVGVAGDTRSINLSKAPTPMVYVVYTQVAGGGLAGSLILRTRFRATAVAPELHRAIWKVDRGVAVPSIQSMGQIVSASLASQRFEALLTSLFAAAALLLACLGIYGVVSYSVVSRTHEIGIRMALGAQKADVLRRMIVQGMMPVLVGLCAGIAGAFGVMRLLSSLLYGVRPGDPLTFIAVSLILAGAAFIACYIPARRATKVNPMVALRYE
jgi:predicted permease